MPLGSYLLFIGIYPQPSTYHVISRYERNYIKGQTVNLTFSKQLEWHKWKTNLSKDTS